MERKRIAELVNTYHRSLLEDVMPFWQTHGVDREHGGFLTFLDRDGSCYCTDKPVWFMGRTTWLFATLYRTVEPRSEWLELACHGYDFLTRHCFADNGKMYFAVTRDGRPLQMRRHAFSEVFGVLACSALAAATQDDAIRRRAVDLFGSLVRYVRTPGMIPPKIDPQTRPMKSLSPLMCLLSVADALRVIDNDPVYEQTIDACIEEILGDFVKPDDGMMLETVAPDGSRIDTPQGRCLNPGHSIETAWFLLEIARRRRDESLVGRAAPLIDWAFDRGWDTTYGGLLYFVDADAKPSAHIEHDLKLWWPHAEALYATLLAGHLTGDVKYTRMHQAVHEWTFGHFPDREHGEWFGYLHRDGSVSSELKGNLWKGAFHIPRALLLSWKLLEEIAG
jgi:N-acylglucosamine 2-epimerase